MQSSTPVSTSMMTGMRASAMRRSVISFARLGHLLRESTRPRVVREWRLADPADEQFLLADLGELDDRIGLRRVSVALDEHVAVGELRVDEMPSCPAVVGLRRRRLALGELDDAAVALSDALDEPSGLIAPAPGHLA